MTPRGPQAPVEELLGADISRHQLGKWVWKRMSSGRRSAFTASLLSSESRSSAGVVGGLWKLLQPPLALTRRGVKMLLSSVNSTRITATNRCSLLVTRRSQNTRDPELSLVPLPTRLEAKLTTTGNNSTVCEAS